jgi:hypothetical protein
MTWLQLLDLCGGTEHLPQVPASGRPKALAAPSGQTDGED